MEWARNRERNAKIKALRANGYSVSKIASELNCSKATVSLHCRGTARQPPSKDGGSISKRSWDRKKETFRKIARDESQTIFNDPSMMLFLGLYWGEGRKAGNGLSICNNDPDIIIVALRVFRRLSSNRVRLQINYYEDHDPAELAEWWLDKTGIEPKLTPIHDKRSKKKPGKCARGQAVLTLNDWRLQAKITTWLGQLKADHTI